jgi:hypothetical protein
MPQIETPPEKKKPSALKIIAVYCLVWLVLGGLFVAYVTFDRDHGGLVQSTAEFLGRIGGVLFVLGLFYVLARMGALHIAPKPQREKSYYDELPK